MKKRILLIVTAIMVLGMTACGGLGAHAMPEGSWYEEMGMLKMVISEKCTVYCYAESGIDPKIKEYAYEYSDGILLLTDETDNTTEFEVTLSDSGKSIDSISYNLEGTQICFSGKETGPKEFAVYQLQLILLSTRLSLVELESDDFLRAAETIALENEIGELENTLMTYLIMISDLKMGIDLSL